MSKQPTFANSQDEFDETDLIEQQNQILEPWIRVVIKGLLYGFAVLIINIVGLLFLNILGFGGLLSIFSDLLLFEAASFFLVSALSIYFGPSPTYADLKARITNTIPKVETTSVSLRKGTTRFLIGVVLLIFS